MTIQYWRRYGHIPAMIVLQFVFIVLFGKFVVYSPESVSYGKDTNQAAKDTMATYPSTIFCSVSFLSLKLACLYLKLPCVIEMFYDVEDPDIADIIHNITNSYMYYVFLEPVITNLEYDRKLNS